MEPENETPVDETQAPVEENPTQEEEVAATPADAPPVLPEPVAPPPPLPPPSPIPAELTEVLREIKEANAQQTSVWQQAIDDARARSAALAERESMPKPPPEEAPEREWAKFHARMASWEMEKQLKTVKTQIEQYTTAMQQAAERQMKAAQDAQLEARRQSDAVSYDTYMRNMLATPGYQFLNDPDWFALFSAGYERVCVQAGKIVDPLPFASAIKAKIGGAPMPGQNPGTEKLKAERTKQAARPQAILNRGSRNSAGSPDVADLMKKHGIDPGKYGLG